ncbi:MAG: gamma-glutamyltransferase [Candidatus Marinimicrobia bacterium]|nr:gamma-glutamyltransferase [Candidatus Neomarinimicrobiota bacterium]MCF7830209.1 gamma-glutamyltransferase [Candidatus Neomarinimicrobiota bacterium]MCF7880826.1 gamma-glutamyltransferase [Candidatus Neomarinimicrobiota bacterium]
MQQFNKNTLLTFILFLLAAHISFAAEISWKASGDKGLVVAGKPQAVAAGIEILQDGGNAADAAASALLVLGVKHIGAFTIGGEVPVIIRDVRTNDVKVLSGQGAAPLDPEAIEWYLENGIPGSSIKAAAVPAVIDLCVTMLQKYGTISFETAVEPTLRILDAGGPSWYIDTSDGDTVDTGRNWYADLAGTLRKLVEAEQMAIGDRVDKLQAVSNRFYRGDIADALDAWYRQKGGFLRKKDLIAHVTEIEEPLKVEYKGYTVYKCGPWTQGPYLLQTLQLLKGFDLQKMGHLSADYIHTVTESMKLALADRDAWYGDPLFSSIPMTALLSERYSDIRRDLIDMKKASDQILPGDPYGMRARSQMPVPQTEQGGTTTLCVSDRWGNVVATTPSGLGSTAGSGGETGVIHGARLVSLNTWKKHPNCIEPGKRPRITLTPTLIMKDDKPVMAISIAGGDLQDQVALQLLLDNIEFGMLPEEAVKAPRFATGHHTGSFGQDDPDIASLRLQAKISRDVTDDLKNRGHQVNVRKGGIGGAAMLYIDPESGKSYGAAAAAGSVD